MASVISRDQGTGMLIGIPFGRKHAYEEVFYALYYGDGDAAAKAISIHDHTLYHHPRWKPVIKIAHRLAVERVKLYTPHRGWDRTSIRIRDHLAKWIASQTPGA